MVTAVRVSLWMVAAVLGVASVQTWEPTPGVGPIPEAITSEVRIVIRGKVSSFGGAGDGKAAGNTAPSISQEGLALWSAFEAEELIRRQITTQELVSSPGGMARRIDPGSAYVAARWPGWDGPDRPRLRRWYRSQTAIVMHPRTGWTVQVVPVDYGPAGWTGRAMDLSPGALKALGMRTDDTAVLSIQAMPLGWK